MANSFEIRLSEANDKPVSLSSMSSEALESFMTVMSSLKSMVLSISTSDKLSFSISEGSAICSVEASEDIINEIYKEFNVAIKGKCVDKDFTDSLRKIQEQLSRPRYNYRFTCKKNSGDNIELQSQLINSTQIRTKRILKSYEFKLKVRKGFLNQIGGNEPNYHFDYGHGEKITIACTMDEAINIKKYLYQDVHSLVLCKEFADPDKRDLYYHKIIIDESLVESIKTFLYKYYREFDLVKKLASIYDVIDNELNKSPKVGLELLKCLLVGFNDKNLDINELKTLLIISKPFKENEIIEIARKNLHETYQTIMTKS